MLTPHAAVSNTLSEVDRLQKSVSKKSTTQIRSADELDLINANINTWFHSRRVNVLAVLPETEIREIDQVYRDILVLTKKASLRKTYLNRLKSLKSILTKLLTDKAVELARAQAVELSDVAPSFDIITSDAVMRKILVSRWNECVGCVQAKLPLAGIVMIGGLLEAVLIARINRLSDQSPVYTAKAAPKDSSTGKVLKLRDWTLNNYIDVAHEMGWISETHKGIGIFLRDYRNYIHPYKEFQHKKKIEPDDAKVLWEIGKTMLRQLLQ